MKKIIICLLSLIGTTSCIETDIVEDQIIEIHISAPNNAMFNNNMTGLVGEQIELIAEATNDHGIIFNPEVTWTNSNPSVASIDKNGVISLLTTGTASIKAEAFGLSSNTILLNVVDNTDEIAIIQIVSPKGAISIGESVQLEATALTVDGNANFPDAIFTWSSTDPDIATVSAEGLVTGVKDGVVTIEAFTEGVTGNYTQIVGEPDARTGSFSGLNGYSVSGTVNLIDADDGLVLELGSDFAASSGPGLYVYLSNNSNNVTGGFEIGALKSNNGAGTYPVNANITIDQYEYVLIWCKPFGVGFGTATLN